MTFCSFVLVHVTPVVLNVANDMENDKMSAESPVYQCAVELRLTDGYPNRLNCFGKVVENSTQPTVR
jgi:hypothetical protein